MMGTQNYVLTCVGIFSNFFGRLRCSVGPESVKKLTSDNGYNCFLFTCTEKKILHGCEISVNSVRDHQPKSYTITDFP